MLVFPYCFAICFLVCLFNKLPSLLASFSQNFQVYSQIYLLFFAGRPQKTNCYQCDWWRGKMGFHCWWAVHERGHAMCGLAEAPATMWMQWHSVRRHLTDISKIFERRCTREFSSVWQDNETSCWRTHATSKWVRRLRSPRLPPHRQNEILSGFETRRHRLCTSSLWHKGETAWGTVSVREVIALSPLIQT